MDVLGILQKIGYTRFNETQTHYAVRPLHRESDNDWAVAIDKRTGRWFDFVKKDGGSIFKLVALTKGLKTKEDVEAFLQMEISSVSSGVQHRYELEEVKRFDKLLLSKLIRDHTYWTKRGVSLATISTFEGGVTHNGRMKNRYVFPILDEQDELIGFSGRDLRQESDVPKWKHIGAKSNWCYPLRWNKHIITQKREAILVESIGDMLSLWDAGVRNTLVTFGISISKTIIEFLLRIDAQRILVSFNNDKEKNLVGNEAATKERRRLLQYFDDSQVVIAIPAYKDFGEMNREQIQSWMKHFKTH